MQKWHIWAAIFVALVLAGWSVGVTTRLSRDITTIERDLDRAFEDLAALARRVAEIETLEETAMGPEVTVYYVRSTPTESHLVPVRQRVAKGTEPMRGALELLVRGPRPESGLERTVPQGTQVRSLEVQGDLVIADFSEEIATNFVGGSWNEALLVGSIVNTLTEFTGIARCQILIEGEKRESIGGHIGIDTPQARAAELIQPR
ncbi:MAG: GerMN domain-containing protein [Firmicutes bacterium]|nr:GerMN domain-containing protein [Bacillota bacterium]